jgi:hypothetical protein
MNDNDMVDETDAVDLEIVEEFAESDTDRNLWIVTSA